MEGFDEQAVRVELDEREQSLRRQIGELTRPPEAGSTIGFGKRIGEGTNQAIQQMADASSAQNLAQLLDDVQRAQRKLDEGTYGACDVCGEPIAQARLEFRPWSATCVRHAR